MPPIRQGIADRLRVEVQRLHDTGLSFYAIAARAGIRPDGTPRVHRAKLAAFMRGADVRASMIDAVAVAVGVRLAFERSASAPAIESRPTERPENRSSDDY